MSYNERHVRLWLIQKNLEVVYSGMTKCVHLLLNKQQSSLSVSSSDDLKTPAIKIHA